MKFVVNPYFLICYIYYCAIFLVRCPDRYLRNPIIVCLNTLSVTILYCSLCNNAFSKYLARYKSTFFTSSTVPAVYRILFNAKSCPLVKLSRLISIIFFIFFLSRLPSAQRGESLRTLRRAFRLLKFVVNPYFLICYIYYCAIFLVRCPDRYLRNPIIVCLNTLSVTILYCSLCNNAFSKYLARYKSTFFTSSTVPAVYRILFNAKSCPLVKLSRLISIIFFIFFLSRLPSAQRGESLRTLRRAFRLNLNNFCNLFFIFPYLVIILYTIAHYISIDIIHNISALILCILYIAH